ncbi:MAG: hypothetical protein EA370_05760 [Wenzhouxiangella sp.]|nr:MAG: hypothetical protein EA370_05760 [Wenzhouxiangella sp.]
MWITSRVILGSAVLVDDQSHLMTKDDTKPRRLKPGQFADLLRVNDELYGIAGADYLTCWSDRHAWKGTVWDVMRSRAAGRAVRVLRRGGADFRRQGQTNLV